MSIEQTVRHVMDTVEADPVNTLWPVAAVAVVVGVGYLELRERFRRPGRPGFADPDVKASREREAALRVKFGFDKPKEP